MKKYFLFMSVLASLFMAGCSQEEIAPGGEENGEAMTSYLSVNLVSSDAAGTRSAIYENGTTDENKVSKVRFYFFTANGAAAIVKAGTNYYDWNSNITQTPVTGNGNVESKLQATIVIDTPKGDKLPQSIVAVLNPDAVGLGSGSLSLTDLKSVTYSKDYTASTFIGEGKFVMFNSVYGNEGKTAEVCAVPITNDHIKKTPEAALTNPVTIHVERSVAKVRVKLGTDVANAATDSKLPLKDKDGHELKVGEEQVYLKLNGWDLTADASCGRLVKAIDLNWGQTWWNNHVDFRSCWAINSSQATNRYYKYTDIATGNIGEGNSLYTNENAANYVSGGTTKSLNRTKVILSGTLYAGTNGATPVTIVRHTGDYFADTRNTSDESQDLPKLKARILSRLEANGYLYYSGDATTSRTQISAGDIEIVIAEQEDIEQSNNNCYVRAKLTEDAAKKMWYTSTDQAAQAITDPETTINNALGELEKALVWNEGRTYYYYEILHDKTGGTNTFGVVRNHIYDTTVTKIAGLGTPVYDPGQVIYPEKPEKFEFYIAAEINILSWHIVSENYELEW